MRKQGLEWDNGVIPLTDSPSRDSLEEEGDVSLMLPQVGILDDAGDKE